MDGVSASKRVEIARWFYRRALREVRARPTPVTWGALVRAAQSLRYARDGEENAAAAARGPPWPRRSR